MRIPLISRFRRLSFPTIVLLGLIIVSLKYFKVEPLEKDGKALPPTGTNVKAKEKFITDPSFREELINERLKSYPSMYRDKKVECKKNRKLTDDEKEHFNKVAEMLKKIRQEIVPYPENYFSGRGIVLSVGPPQLSFARVNLQMIAFTSTRLPVQVWYSSSQVSKQSMKPLLDVAPNINVSLCNYEEHQCEHRTGITKIDPSRIYKRRSDSPNKSFPYKPASIISSTFAEVLFLDCDSYIVRDPEELFRTDPMYERFGALLYPDSYKTRQHPHLWTLLNTSCAEDEYEVDSAMILMNKAKVWKGLYATKLMNDYHEVFYKYASEGDKDTFRLGFRFMQVPYYLVVTPCASGRFDGKRFCGHTLCKTDSLAQRVYVNHVHMFKYDPIQYTPESIAYTRVGLGDPNNHPFVLQQCRLREATISCFHVVKLPTTGMNKDYCFIGEVPREEHENHTYSGTESLLYDRTRKNQIVMTKTNNLMPSFVEHVLQLLP